MSLSATRPKLRREEVPAGACLCDYCTAKCCRYFALPIEQPETDRDWQYVRWYLMHAAATVFKEDDTWYLLVHTTCKHLQDDHRCGVYFTRPTICREYSTDNCEYEDEWLYEQYLETSEQVSEYAEALLPVKRGRSIRGPKPAELPLLTG